MPDPTPSSSDPANRPTPERRIADSLLSGLLLAFSGGALDAFLYRNHGHVFAGAMTGNAVLCGIAVLGENAHEAIQHFLPIIAFVIGVWASEVLQDRLRHHAVTVGLACEAGGLLLCSFLPATFPNLFFNPIISLLAAYQVASFRKVDSFSYNSTFITGNLRTAVVGLYRAARPSAGPSHQDEAEQDRAEGLREVRDLGLVLLFFISGAVAGSLLAPHAGNHTLWLPVLTLVIVLVLMLVRSRQPSS